MKKKGFTLIEVLIVVIIIGILATLLLPQMGQMAERTRTAEAKNMIGALRTLLTVSYMEDSAWPTGTMGTNTEINTTLGQAIDTGTSLFNYAITGTGANRTITAVRNNNDWATGATGATITIVIGPTGTVVTDMATTYNITAPAAPN